jgi:hypothetical protein
MKMRVRQRIQNFLSPIVNDALNANDRLATLERQISGIGQRLDLLNSPSNALTRQEAAHLERYRMERRLLADWSGDRRQQLVDRSQALLAKLRPVKAKGFQKARFGSRNDGGYVILDDFKPLDYMFSFGVEHNADFDLYVAEQGVQVIQFDHTIDRAPVENPRIRWEKKKIAPQATEGSENIANLVKTYRIGENRPNALLKIDIEHDEWPVFDATPASDLKKFTQITGEFHGFDYLSELARLEVVERVIDKLTENFAVVHVHANNHCDVADFFGLTVPYVLEFTFANRDLYQFEDTAETFPGPLDAPCDPGKPDIRLGAFRY